ncbi:Tyrosine-protein kinase SPK-1 [Taenia solium]|eukprot:TsM_000592800 transcript=TsM_000592800 gene=TsM_000592800
MGLRRRLRNWRENLRQKRKARANASRPVVQEPQRFQSNEQKWIVAKSPKPLNLFMVTALYDFFPTQPDECGFSAGDPLEVVDSSNTWWMAKNYRTKERGLIPSNYVTSDASLSNVCEAWYDVDRLEAERRLLVPGVQFGTYILRPCEQPGSPYCLSVRANGVNIKHFRVYVDEGGKRFCLSPDVSFGSLEALISYYQSNLIDAEVGLVEARPHRVPPPLSFKECFIHYEDVNLEKELGRGHFGVVFAGSIRSVRVAVKKSLTGTNDEAFHEEAKVMHILSHQRIVRFLGFCCDAPDGHVLIITEFMPNGALRDYLQTSEGRSLTYQQLISITDQVVKAMVYLEKVKVVHRDLRAANVLVDADGSVKVADFGLTKILGFNQNFTEGSFPFRWTAPEATNANYKPDTKADVWSFGVLMFEVLTYGRTPYEECKSLAELMNFLVEGRRLPSPQTFGFPCDSVVYSIMKSCWEMHPEERPSFQKLSADIEGVIVSMEGRYDACWNTMVEN